MFSTIRFIAKRILFREMVPALMIIAVTLFPVWALADEDPCGGTGIYIGNQTTLDLWYTRDGGPCTIWNHDHLLVMKPEEILMIYRDTICKTEYCSKNPTYDIYKSLDADRNCRVRILPNCTLADM